jgi:tRNA wybutosine-synthesizing protein 2
VTRTPHEEVLTRLRLPQDLMALVPVKWEKLGDVVILRLPPALRPHAGEVAGAFADALGARCIVEDRGGVTGELREMQTEILYGDDPVGMIVENGVKYRLDASRVMFSSGNVAERTRAGKLDAAGETVVDMFAGIGYFTLPIALYTGAARVVALEKNPASYRYLEENIALNKVEHVVEPWLGDNRVYPRAGFADRVLMGYFPGCAKFLPTAFQLLRPSGGRIHYHDSAHAERWKEEMTRAFLDAARDAGIGPRPGPDEPVAPSGAKTSGRLVAFEESYVVKSYAPGVVHAVLVARVTSG